MESPSQQCGIQEPAFLAVSGCILQEPLSVAFHAYSTRKKELDWPYAKELAEMDANSRT